jgi:hypothetical protein
MLFHGQRKHIPRRPFTMTVEPEKSGAFNPDQWMSKGDASRARGVSRQAIWELVNRGRLTTLRHAGRLYVSRAEVMSFKRRPRGPSGTGYIKGRKVRPKKKNFDPTKWISPVEAARMAGFTRQVIADLIRRHTLRTLVSENKTFVQVAGIEKFMRQQSKLRR